MAFYMLSLPRGEDSPPLDLNERLENNKDMPLLTIAAFKGMARVVEALLGHGADLLARDLDDHLAVCLLFHAIDNTVSSEAVRLAMVRCLVEKWGANVRALLTDDSGDESYPLFIAASAANHDVVAFFLDECGMDVSMATPSTKNTVIHDLMSSRSDSKIEAVRMLKYLVEEKGASHSLPNAAGLCACDMVLLSNNATFFNYFLSVRDGAPKSVADLAPSDEWESPEEEEAAMMMAVERLNRRFMDIEEQEEEKEAATKVLLDEQKAKHGRRWRGTLRIARPRGCR